MTALYYSNARQSLQRGKPPQRAGSQISDVVAGEILNSEFQWISRESDVLIRVESPEYGKFLVLNQLQLRYNPEMPRRMRAYTGLAEEKFELVLPGLIRCDRLLLKIRVQSTNDVHQW